jgi:ABC-type cobalamin transport system ATPase subunit
LLQQVSNQLVHDFLSQQNNPFFLSLWIYLSLAETSQQPISQTSWLKVTPHCNYCF